MTDHNYRANLEKRLAQGLPDEELTTIKMLRPRTKKGRDFRVDLPSPNNSGAKLRTEMTVLSDLPPPPVMLIQANWDSSLSNIMKMVVVLAVAGASIPLRGGGQFPTPPSTLAGSTSVGSDLDQFFDVDSQLHDEEVIQPEEMADDHDFMPECSRTAQERQRYLMSQVSNLLPPLDLPGAEVGDDSSSDEGFPCS